jgi:membrane protein YqaA with SNARE-associated domain
MPRLIQFFRSLFRLAFHAGGLGLLSVGVLDSSILMLPLGNDFLIVALSARHPARVPYYVAMAAIGSIIGTYITVWLSRKGAEGVERKTKSNRLQKIEKKVKEHAGWAVGLASLMPPPFPFTFFVALAAALKYPVKKLLFVVGAGRLARFGIEGLLAVKYGRWILSLAESPRFKYFIIFVAVISIAGTSFSIFQWVRRSQGTQRAHARAA